MKASKFTDAQKAFVVKQGEEGTPVAEICRKAGISQATYVNWKKRYAGLMPSEMRRLQPWRLAPIQIGFSGSVRLMARFLGMISRDGYKTGR
jgi:transposase